jgi:SAM-dependent methyltransferase
MSTRASDTPFDALATQYDRQRPHYPDQLFEVLCELVPDPRSGTAVDAGAGTGIGLQGLIRYLGPGWRYIAVDISEGMATIGRRRWPEVEWRLGRIEEVLDQIGAADLVLAAQSVQWFDRPRFYQACGQHLVHRGALAVLQNNREWTASGFLESYETLLERCSPGYTRHYRSFDVEAEFASLDWGSGSPIVKRSRWTRRMSIHDFIEMSSSSTRAQAALKADPDGFPTKVRSLCEEYASEGVLDIPYTSELFVQHKTRALP